MTPYPVPPKAADVVAWITLRLDSDGAMSISGTIGDRKLALRILDSAKEAITRQIPASGIMVPPRDADVMLPQHLTAVGDMRPGERGDG